LKPSRYFVMGGFYYFILSVVAFVGSFGARRAGDRVWMLLLPFAALVGIVAYRRLRANDL
jgi:hypothetical protein